jgi:hypothetical protein
VKTVIDRFSLSSKLFLFLRSFPLLSSHLQPGFSFYAGITRK